MTIIYNKLIRDKIPEIITKSNKTYQIKTLSSEEYKNSLKQKLLEEVNEFLEAHEDNLMEEIADIYEVLSATINAYGLNKETIETIRQNKAQEKGKFDKKIQLVSVSNQEDKGLDNDINFINNLEKYLEENISKKANKLDHSKELLKQVFLTIAKDNPLWLSLKLPVEWGGLGVSNKTFFTSKMMMAKYSGALAFLQAQHQTAVGMLSKSDNQIVKEKYLPNIAKGLSFCGVAFSHLRRLKNAPLKAIAHGDGYQLTGDIFWITGFNIFEYFIVGAVLEDGGELYAIAPFRNIEKNGGKIIINSPMQLGALDATNTVSATMEKWYIHHDDIIKINPPQTIIKDSEKQILNNSAFALGCAEKSLELINQNANKLQLESVFLNSEKLMIELKNIKQTILTEIEKPSKTTQEKLNLRIKAINLGFRCAQGAVITSKGSANLHNHTAQRLYKEALVYSVSGQTIPILEGSFEMLVK
ncbi:acyl-CoA dehydrogenase family protein [Cyanobacterium stanieri LEGE 03274]|uniref:Acyl-CoA dehydrogenase family protein n=1 Tax=Cyanobacterium stanieri LEGE 03274 TaxID=1828756 RepID=A0ABR9V1V3_9CHRO|nr:acyl-CoA dehydrogenase family protein [Cyanobacterium stanieri]MBE9221876.1 acyl-CoA dehydrogenase family protein [Cyanobacterium stanieri LEGE 03274]